MDVGSWRWSLKEFHKIGWKGPVMMIMMLRCPLMKDVHYSLLWSAVLFLSAVQTAYRSRWSGNLRDAVEQFQSHRVNTLNSALPLVPRQIFSSVLFCSNVEHGTPRLFICFLLSSLSSSFKRPWWYVIKRNVEKKSWILPLASFIISSSLPSARTQQVVWSDVSDRGFASVAA